MHPSLHLCPAPALLPGVSTVEVRSWSCLLAFHRSLHLSPVWHCLLVYLFCTVVFSSYFCPHVSWWRFVGGRRGTLLWCLWDRCACSWGWWHTRRVSHRQWPAMTRRGVRHEPAVRPCGPFGNVASFAQHVLRRLIVWHGSSRLILEQLKYSRCSFAKPL